MSTTASTMTEILFEAIEENLFNIASGAVKDGADVNAVDSSDGGNTPLICAAKKGDFDMACMLLRNEADANAKNYNGDTAIKIAVSYGDLSFIKLLLEHGADLNCRDGENNTLLIEAIKREKTELVGMLIDMNIDFLAKNNNGQDALSVAINHPNRKIDIAKLLIDKIIEKSKDI